MRKGRKRPGRKVLSWLCQCCQDCFCLLGGWGIFVSVAHSEAKKNCVRFSVPYLWTSFLPYIYKGRSKSSAANSWNCIIRIVAQLFDIASYQGHDGFWIHPENTGVKFENTSLIHLVLINTLTKLVFHNKSYLSGASWYVQARRIHGRSVCYL